MDEIGWKGLIGKRFKWTQQDKTFNFYIAERGRREDTEVTVEYPIEIIGESPSEEEMEDQAQPSTNSKDAAEPAKDEADGDETKEREQFKDMVMLIADGLGIADLRKAGKDDDDLKQFPMSLRAELARGKITDELIDEERLEKDDEGVFHVKDA